jgi:hypothetical protein
MGLEIWEKKIMRSPESPFCPIPGMGYCIRERCNYWHEAKEECTATCFDSTDQESGAADPDGGCLITFYEDFD